MSRNSLLEAGAKSEDEVTATGFEPRTLASLSALFEGAIFDVQMPDLLENVAVVHRFVQGISEIYGYKLLASETLCFFDQCFFMWNVVGIFSQVIFMLLGQANVNVNISPKKWTIAEELYYLLFEELGFFQEILVQPTSAFFKLRNIA